MTRTTIPVLVTLVALAAPSVAAGTTIRAHLGPAQPKLTLKKARVASETFAGDYIAAAFSEKPPRVRAKCHREGRRKASCKVSVRGDRIDATLRTVVKLTRDGENIRVYASNLASQPTN